MTSIFYTTKKHSILFLLCFSTLFSDPAYIACLKYIPRRPIILEAGAHDGTNTIQLSNQFPRGKIYSFECHPIVYNQTKQHIANHHLKNITLFELGLGEYVGTAEFHMSSPTDPNSKGCDAQSSLLPPSDEYWLWSHIQFIKKAQINVTTIDAWAEKNNVDHIDFIWLDTQGSEYNILKASPKILATVRAFKTEFSTRPFYEGCVCFDEYSEWLESEGFVCVYKDDAIHGDAAFVRKELLSNTNIILPRVTF